MLTLILTLSFLQDPSPTPTPSPAAEKEVVITAKRHESELLETPTGTTVLKREDIEKTTAHTLVDVLQGRAGLMVTKNSSTPQDAVVDARGFNNGGGNGNRLLVLVDGRKVNTVSGSSIDWAGIPLENVERIEIVRGPGAALYGDTAVAGVVNIITKRPTKEPAGEAEVGFGSFQTFRSSGSYRATEGPVGFALFAGREASDGFRDNSAFLGENATALLTMDLAKAKLWTKFGLHDDHRQRPGTLTKAEIEQFGRDGSVTIGDDADDRNGFFDLGADIDVRGGTLTPSLFFTTDHANAHTTFSSGSTGSDTQSKILQAAVKHVAKLTLFDAPATLVAGFELNRESADADSLSNFPPFFIQASKATYDRNLQALYARLEARPLPELLASLGGRYDTAQIEFERVDDDLAFGGQTRVEGKNTFKAFSPQASVSYLLTDLTSVYVSAGRTFRYPNRDELVGFLTSAVDLDPERGTVFELGVRSREWSEASGSLVIYQMDMVNEIFFVPPATGEDTSVTFNFGANENIDKVKHSGVELELESSVLDPVSLLTSITYQRTELGSGDFKGSEMPITPNLMASLTLSWRGECGLTANLTGRYVGERFLLNDLSNDVDPLPAVGIVDARVTYRLKKALFFLEGNNLFNREYFDNGGIGGTVWGSRQGFNPAPGANFLGGMGVKF